MEEKHGKWYGHTSYESRKRYNQKTYEQLAVRLPIGERAKIKAAADAAQMSMAEYLCAALTAYGCPVSSKVKKD